MPEYESNESLDAAQRPPVEELLGNIVTAAAVVEEAKQNLIMNISLARREKLSWAVIGEALGVTRQAAWERFSESVRDFEAD